MNSKAVKASWSSLQYLKFEAERTRPSRDLLAQAMVRLNGREPKRVVDLGCGPANSTAVLATQFPAAKLSGMDSSQDMIDKARASLPEVDFSLGDLSTYTPPESTDLFFSNAVFQWLPRNERLEIVKRLMRHHQPSKGVFAFQVPDNLMESVHVEMRETAKSGPWADKLWSAVRDSFQTPQEIYDELKPSCTEVDIWHTSYYHPLEDHQAVVEWVKGTGLLPFLTPLNAQEREAFLAEYLKRLQAAYPVSFDGRVLLRYPRLFVVAVKS